MGYLGPNFNLCNRRDRAGSVQEKFDRGVSCIDRKQIFPTTCVKHLEFWHSNHQALLLYFEGRMNRNCSMGQRQRRRFFFKSFWVDKSECHDLVSNNWSQGGNL